MTSITGKGALQKYRKYYWSVKHTFYNKICVQNTKKDQSDI